MGKLSFPNFVLTLALLITFEIRCKAGLAATQKGQSHIFLSPPPRPQEAISGVSF